MGWAALVLGADGGHLRLHGELVGAQGLHPTPPLAAGRAMAAPKHLPETSATANVEVVEAHPRLL